MRANQIDHEKKIAHFNLKDFLGPNGRYPYDSLQTNSKRPEITALSSICGPSPAL